MVRGVLLGVVAAALLYFVWRFVAAYRAAQGSTWDRLLGTSRNSVTILWQYIVAAAALVLTYTAQVADFFNMPEVRDFITKQLSPEMVSVAFLTIAVVGFAARLRTL